MQNTGQRVGQLQVTRFIGRYSRITSHSIPALSWVRRHHHRLASRHYLARANVGAGFPHCPGVHGCIRPVTPSRPGLPHHISLNWKPSTLAAPLPHYEQAGNMGLDQKLQYNLLAVPPHIGSPPCQLLDRPESESRCLLACLLSKSEERGKIASSWHTLPQLWPSPIFHRVSLRASSSS